MLDGTPTTNSERITRVELLDTQELLLGIEGEGKPSYQYVYREAAGVYWDNDRFGFKSTPLVKWTCAMWFAHIVCIVQQGLDVELILGTDVEWHRIPEDDRLKIQRGAI